MTEVLVCIELPGQVREALEAVRHRGISQYSILALTPHVEYTLDRIGHAYRRPEDYHSEDDIDAVGLEDMSVLDQFCDAVDSYVQSQWSLLRQYSIRPMRMNWHHLKCLFNSVSIRAFIARRILEAENPHQVLYFGTQPESIHRELFFVHESVWSSVIPVVSRSLGITCEPLRNDTDPTVLNIPPSGVRRTLRATVRRSVRNVLRPKGIRLLRSCFNSLRAARLKGFPLATSKQRVSRPAVLALGDGYSLDHLLQRVTEQGDFDLLFWDIRRALRPVYLNRPIAYKNNIEGDGLPSQDSLRDQGRNLWSEVKSLDEFVTPLRFSGVDCLPVMERRLQHLFESNLPEVVLMYLRARSLIKSERPFVIVEALMVDCRLQAIALAGREEGIPFVVYRHGDSGGHIWMENWVSHIDYFERTDLQQADYVLAFGEGDVAFFEKSKKPDLHVIPVGSAVLDETKKHIRSSVRGDLHRRSGLDPRKKTVMYVTTGMDGNIRLAPYRSRSPSRMFRLERSIIEVFAEFPHIQFVVKTKRSTFTPYSPTVQFVRDRQFRNIEVVTGPFLSYIPMADMFITDYPSTAFLEMLTTDRPILVCGHELPRKFNREKWHPSLLDMWKERVAYADDLEEFLELLRDYLREERFQAVESSDTLLKLFGTHLDDGRSVDRAYAFLEALATQPRVEIDKQVAT